MSKSQNTILHVRERSVSGKKVKQLKKQGFIPGNVYGLNKTSESIEVNASTFSKLINEHGDTTLIYLQVGDDKQVPALIGEIQYNPVTDQPIHVTFKRVNLNVKVTAEIPVEVVGEFTVPEATAILTRNVLEVEALPADLPEMFEVSVAGLTEVGQTIGFSDLNYDRSKISILLTAEELESPLVIVQEVKEEVVEVATPAEGEAGTEGETPAAEGSTEATAEATDQKAEESDKE